MNKEDILDKLENFLAKNPNPYVSGCNFKYNEEQKFNGFHSDSWITGGMTGGDCWGNDADNELECEEEEEINLLDKFLAEYFPEINMVQYTKLHCLVNRDDWEDDEYYGNYTRKSCSYITFEDIANYLSKMK